jgi:hypothetical protein
MGVVWLPLNSKIGLAEPLPRPLGVGLSIGRGCPFFGPTPQGCRFLTLLKSLYIRAVRGWCGANCAGCVGIPDSSQNMRKNPTKARFNTYFYQNPQTKRWPENVWFRRLKRGKMATGSSRSEKVKRIFQQFDANHGTVAWAVSPRRSRGTLLG